MDRDEGETNWIGVGMTDHSFSITDETLREVAEVSEANSRAEEDADRSRRRREAFADGVVEDATYLYRINGDMYSSIRSAVLVRLEDNGIEP